MSFRLHLCLYRSKAWSVYRTLELLCVCVCVSHCSLSGLSLQHATTKEYSMRKICSLKVIADTVASLQGEGRLLRGEHNLLGEAFLVMASTAG